MIQKSVNGKAGALDLQQAQTLALRTLAEERRIALLQEEQGLVEAQARYSQLQR